MLQRRRLRNQILQVRSPRWPKCEADETLEALRRPNPRWGFILGGGKVQGYFTAIGLYEAEALSLLNWGIATRRKMWLPPRKS